MSSTRDIALELFDLLALLLDNGFHQVTHGKYPDHEGGGGHARSTESVGSREKI